MSTVGLYSEDRTLFPLLSSALGKDFRLKLESTEQGMNDLVSAGGCDVMILDLNSSSDAIEDKLECVRRLMQLPLPAVIMGDAIFRTEARDLIRDGAFGYCSTPPSIRDLKALLSRAHETSILRRQLNAVQGKLEEPVGCDQLKGSSLQMQRVYQVIKRVTNISTSVLVTGESGTGKELIARAIHNLGSRSGRPFVAVSCGAIPETLIESELFGHEKGAFTGTVGTREGYFEKVGDGTLFLDEIGELSLMTQVKLLRVLQQMEFSRLGSSRLIPLRARLIFATNRNLPKMVAEGTFRQDLFYRINVMQIVSPALRDRIEDIPQIAMHFLKQYSQSLGKPDMRIDSDAMALLQSYSWPGNVRELENVMQRAIILAPESVVRTEDLTLNTQEEEGDAANLVDIGDYNPSCSFERQLRDYKVKLALTAVRENNGNKTMAARSLGITRAYVHRLIRLAEPEPYFDVSTTQLTAAAGQNR
jgi:DNA-binding NtrC family response regulator